MPDGSSVSVIKTSVHALLSLLFFVAGVGHLTVLHEDFAVIVPPPFDQRRDEIVVITGIMEIMGGLGLLVPSLRNLTKLCLTLFLIAVFPANIYGSQHGIKFRGQPHPSIPVRLALQILLVVLIWWSSPDEYQRFG